ncbi:MAG: helix-turn-helix domain-containing protein [Pyrinomonadaceae bacterium]
MLENRRQFVAGHDEPCGAGEDQEERDGSSMKIHALKELTLALLKEVETMKEGRQLDGARVVNFSDEVRRFEIDLIRWALMRTGGHQRRAARLLNIKVTTLNAKIKRFNLRPATVTVGNVVDFYPDTQRS